MEAFKTGEQVWVVLVEGEEGFNALDRNGVLEASEPTTSVVVAPVTVLEGGEMGELVSGTTFALLPGRTFRTVEEAEGAAEELAGEATS